MSIRTPLFDPRERQAEPAAATPWTRRPPVIVVAVALALVAAGALAFVLVAGGDRAGDAVAAGPPAVPPAATTGPPQTDPEAAAPKATGKVRNPFEAGGAGSTAAGAPAPPAGAAR